MKKFVCVIITVLLSIQIYSQEALKSIEEEYFDFLALQGLIERPTLGYRTLSDSVWNINEDVQHIWKNNNLGKSHILFKSENQGQNWFSKGFFHGLKLKIFGPEWFNSYNTTAPYGQNDGALWQGRGYNTSFTTGVRLEGYGFEATFKPQLSFSQNLDFEIMPSNYDSEFGYFWGYGKNIGIDAPQRFGDKAFFTFDWGDSEIRYSWKTLTIGFGTQSIWLGPAQINPILHSNNAPTYPKIDIGLRKTEINIPWGDLYLGDIEFRYWAGKLTESNYFDNDESNNNSILYGLSLFYSPKILRNFTIGLNRVIVFNWNKQNLFNFYRLFSFKKINISNKNTGEDQKISIILDWNFSEVGFEFYTEIGFDDFTSDILSNPFHTAIYTIGIKQIIPNKFKNFDCLLSCEWNNFEMSQDFQMQWKYMGFYSHHLINKGYTNIGEIIGAGTGYFGNSQFIQLQMYYPKGKTSFYYHRHSPNSNYIYNKTINSSDAANSPTAEKYYAVNQTYHDFGIKQLFYINSSTFIQFSFDYVYIRHYNYVKKNDCTNIKIDLLFSIKF